MYSSKVRQALTVEQSLLNLFTGGHHKRTVLEYGLIQRLSCGLNHSEMWILARKLIQSTHQDELRPLLTSCELHTSLSFLR